MKSKWLLLPLIVLVIFCSVSAVSAMEHDVNSSYEIQNHNLTSDSNVGDSDDQYDFLTVKPVNFVAPSIEKYYKNGTSFDAILTDYKGNPISKQPVIFTVKGVSYVKITNNGGIASLPINLVQGTYSITALYNGTENYNSAVINSKIIVLPTVIGEDLVKYYKNGTPYSVKVIDSKGNPLVNSKVAFTIKSKTYTLLSDSDGIATLPINLAVGNYEIVAKNLADNTYRKDSITVIPNVIGGNLVKYYKNGTPYSVKVIDSKGNPLVNSKVAFTVKSKTYTLLSDSDGIASLPINLNIGTYSIISKNLADNTFRQDTIYVIPNIVTADLVKGYGDDKNFEAKIIDSEGNPVSGAKVRFTVANKDYNRITNSEGIASLYISFNPGTYKIKTTNLDNGQSCNNNLKILSRPDSNISVLNTVIDDNSGNSLKIVLSNVLGNKLPNRNVVLVVDGKSYNAVSDNKGVVTFNPRLNAGNYSALYIYLGNNYNGETSIYSNITVLKGKTTTLEVSTPIVVRGESLDVIVNDVDGNILPNVHISFNVLNKNYTVISNEEGIASLPINLNQGVVPVSYAVAEQGYSPVTGLVNVTVVSDNPNVKFENDANCYIKGQKFSAKLLVDNVYLANQEVSISVNNKNYDLVSNEKGIVSFVIDEEPGTYDITCTYDGNSILDAVKTTFYIIVLDSMDTSLRYVGEKQFSVEDGGNFSVRLVGSNNIPIGNQNISFKLKSISYYGTTDENGIASLPIHLSKGNYEIFYKFEGNGQLLGSSGSQKFSVESKFYKRNGYMFIWRDEDADFKALAKQGTTDVFVHCKNIIQYGEENVLKWIRNANSYGINVYLWVPIFHNNVQFIPPINEDGTQNREIVNQRLNEAKYYATLPGLSGILIDFIRFPGTAHYYQDSASIISNVVKDYADTVRSANPDLLMLSTIIPRERNTVYDHAQDIHAIAKCVDVIVPLIYKSAFTEKVLWISNLAKWCYNNAEGTPLWVALLGYKADAIQEPISLSEINRDIKITLKQHIDGIQIFRWGATPHPNFNELY
ncbi:MAG: hypothetical protein Q4P18_06330 [Methanobrevibacter sp.]|uniref:MSCRAMM family protein n=1 Tax=Methanobrevibacter sp. TaxID=66852 RepID=UPI0026E019EB|nr:hypothetical protein [Methanobrevibacter sp.]MDO5849131.1 hypothetical protein [Methanobrevibacter sp.]